MAIILGINVTSATLNYSSENISISANSSVSIPNYSIIAFSQDPQVISDINNGNLQISDTVNIYTRTDALQFLAHATSVFNHADKSGNGTLVNVSDTVVATTSGCSSVTFNLTGTWSGSLIIEATVNGTDWFTWAFITPAGVIGSSAVINGTATSPCGSLSQVRLRATAMSSGTANVAWSASNGSNVLQVYNLTSASLMTTARLQDGSGNNIASINGQIEDRDVINVSSQYRAQSVTTSAAEATGAASRLTNRKFISITPTNGTVYWGTSSGVTTSTGSPLFPNNTLFLSFTDNVPVYLISAGTVDVRILEGS